MNKTMKILMAVFGFLLMFGLVFGEAIVTTARDYVYDKITITADPKITNEMLGITDEKAEVPPEQAIKAYADVGIEAKTRQEIAITRQSITDKVNQMFFDNDLDGLRKADECVKAIGNLPAEAITG